MKTHEEIFTDINNKQAEHTELAEINSTSRVSVWGLIKWIFAEMFLIVIKYLELHKFEVETIIANAPYATVNWYIERAKEFQLNDALIEQNGKFVYAETDATKQIIKQVAVIPLSRNLIFKIAKEDNSSLVACSEDEKTKFVAYVNQIKYPGTFVSVESFDADKLILRYKIEYNAMLDVDVVQSAVESTLSNYVRNITFNGKYNTTAATDELQKLSEVSNAFFVSASGRTNLQSESLADTFTEYYESTAGYMVIDRFEIEYKPV